MTKEANDKVLAIVANIVNSNQDKSSESSINEVEEEEEKSPTTSTYKKETIRGIPKSGRFWKSKKERFSTINKTKGLRSSFAKKTALRIELKKTKEMSKQLLQEIKQKEIDRKERRRQNILRTEENKRKAEVVQIITNTAKLKRMRKKQLRFIEKRDTSKQTEPNK